MREHKALYIIHRLYWARVFHEHLSAHDLKHKRRTVCPVSGFGCICIDIPKCFSRVGSRGTYVDAFCRVVCVDGRWFHGNGQCSNEETHPHVEWPES